MHLPGSLEIELYNQRSADCDRGTRGAANTVPEPTVDWFWQVHSSANSLASLADCAGSKENELNY